MRMPANLKMRAITSFALIVALALIVIGDDYFPSMIPFLTLLVLLATFLCACELDVLAVHGNDHEDLFKIAILAPIGYFWYLHTQHNSPPNDFTARLVLWFNTQLAIIGVVVMMAFEEMRSFWVNHDCTRRTFNRAFITAYLVLPACVILDLRWSLGTNALLVTFLVPKLGDVGAYLTGSLIGKHKMTPTLSPKKTWEGFFGGLIVSMLTAVAINFLGREPLFKNGVLEAMAFGLIVGLAGVFGDLFESMLKRDAMTKDASQSVPGFGGVLDVVDSVLFAAPVAYLFFLITAN